MRMNLRQAGMSMVELMVAMAIALIGTIIIFQVFEVSEGIRRTTTSGGDAAQNGAIGLYVIENDLPGSDDITPDSAAYSLSWVSTGPVGVTSRFNPGGGSHQFGGVGATATRVYNIGNFYDDDGAFNYNGPTAPVFNTYTVAGNNLTATSRFAGGAGVP